MLVIRDIHDLSYKIETDLPNEDLPKYMQIWNTDVKTHMKREMARQCTGLDGLVKGGTAH